MKKRYFVLMLAMAGAAMSLSAQVRTYGVIEITDDYTSYYVWSILVMERIGGGIGFEFPSDIALHFVAEQQVGVFPVSLFSSDARLFMDLNTRAIGRLYFSDGVSLDAFAGFNPAFGEYLTTLALELGLRFNIKHFYFTTAFQLGNAYFHSSYSSPYQSPFTGFRGLIGFNLYEDES